MTHQLLSLDHLVPHPANIRNDLGDLTELAASIDQNGILQPLVVMEAPAKRGTYVVLAGHRRLAAARMLRLREVPCVITTNAQTIARQLVLMLVENMQRSDLTAADKAKAFGELRSRGMSVADIAQRVGLTTTTVYYYLQLLELDTVSLNAVHEGRVEVQAAVQAVKRVRAEQRRREGHHNRGRPVVVEPEHLTGSHPLAAAARRMCTHSTRRKIRDVACGQCWEAAIRADERDAIAREQTPTAQGAPA